MASRHPTQDRDQNCIRISRRLSKHNFQTFDLNADSPPPPSDTLTATPGRPPQVPRPISDFPKEIGDTNCSASGSTWDRAMCPPEVLRVLLQRRPKILLRAEAEEQGAGGGQRWSLARFFHSWTAMSWSTSAGPSSSSSSSTRRPEQSRSPFTEDQFLAICREAAKPREAADGSWQLMVDSAAFSIYRLLDEKTGLYEYKVYSLLPDCPPDLCADVYMDLNYRTKWDQYLREMCEKTHDGRTVIYWELKFPFPLANRDYVFIRERQDMEVDGQKFYVVLAKNVATTKFPERPGIVRVKNYSQSVAFVSDGKKGSKVFMSYFEDPGGKIPSWLVNWATKTGVPNFLKDMQRACYTYHKR